MKTKILVLLIGCFFVTPFVKAQRDTVPSRMGDHELGMTYLEKSKKQKTTAWILLGVGVAGWIGGSIAYNNAWNNWDGSSSDPGTGAAVVELLGFGCTIASVPVFINAAKNKGRAEILLRNENILMGYQQRPVQSVPSAGIAISLGKR